MGSLGPFRPSLGPFAADAPHLRADLARCRHGGVGVHHRRERHRQGSRRADRARPEPPPQASVPGRQLRRDLAQPDRERDLRPRERQLHRRRSPAPGLLRARPRRHAVPRRDHRDAAGAAGQAAARARDGHVHARRLHGGPGNRRARHRRHQPPARAGRVVRQAARRPAVPPERVPDRAAAAARPLRGRAAAGPALPDGHLRARRHVQDLHAGRHAAPAPPTAGPATCASCATSSSAPT